MKIGKHRITPEWGNIVLSRYKSFEYQFDFNDLHHQLFEINFSWTEKRDHAGLSFHLSLFRKMWMRLAIYDHRHWDNEINDWKK